MRLEDLEVFIEVANQKSMSLAGNKLYISPQAISATITRLETELHVRLFDRTRQGIYLNENGKKVYNYAQIAINEYDNLQNNLHNEDQNIKCVSGEIRILSSMNLAFLISMLSKVLQKEHPKIKITLLEQTDLCLTNYDFDERDFDLICTSYEKGFLLTKTGRAHPNHDAYILKEENLRLFMKESDPLIKKKALSLNALKKLPLICYCTYDSDSQIYTQILRNKGIKLNHIFASNNINLCLDYLENNVAYCLATSLLFNTLFKPIQTSIFSIPLKEKITIVHALFVKQNSSNAVNLLTDLIKNYFGNNLQNIDDFDS